MPADATVAVDLSPIVQSLIGLAAAVVTACIPLITAAIARHFKVSADSAAIVRINVAAENAAGRIFAQFAAQPVGVSLPSGAAMVAREAVRVAEIAKESAARLGVNDQRIAEIISGKLGKLLAADPAIRTGVTP